MQSAEIKTALTNEIREAWINEDVKVLCKYYFKTDITPGQEAIVHAVAFDKDPRTVIVCMTRYGKSWAVAQGILLWILNNPGKKIGIIAPTNEKTTIIRNYVAIFISICPVLLGLLDLERTGASRIQKEVSRKRMTWKHRVEMRTLSAEGAGQQLMGFGFDKVVVDEECDIEYETYRAKITRMLGESPDSTYVGIGNPWHRDNQFYEHWTNVAWKKIHIGWKQAVEEGRISIEFVEEQRMTLTPMEFTVLYEAEFPEESEDQLIHYKWIMHATRGFNPVEITGPSVARMGVDVARTGKDSTVLTVGFKIADMYVVEEVKEYKQQDTMKTADDVYAYALQKNPNRITIDTNGVGGGVTDRLNQIKKDGRVKANVVAFMGGEKPTTEAAQARFSNKKAEAYFHLRTLFEEGRIIIPRHGKLLDQLNKMKWGLNSNQKIRIYDPGEAPDDTAEQKSPDFADSLCYFAWEQKDSFVFRNIALK
jgi:hypothetical protein